MIEVFEPLEYWVIPVILIAAIIGFSLWMGSRG